MPNHRSQTLIQNFNIQNHSVTAHRKNLSLPSVMDIDYEHNCIQVWKPEEEVLTLQGNFLMLEENYGEVGKAT